MIANHQVRKNSLNIKFLGGIFLGHPGPRRRDIPDKNFMQVAFFCCLDREWPGCPGIWVGTSRIWKNFMQENFGLIFRTLNHCAIVNLLRIANLQSCSVFSTAASLPTHF